MEVDYDDEKGYLSQEVIILKKDLLDIEVKLIDALNIAFKDFEARLRILITTMKERTGTFFEEGIEEVL